MTLTILAGPFDTRAEGWHSFCQGDYAEVPNPRVIHNPEDNKYYVVEESESPRVVDYCQSCGGSGCGCPDCVNGLVEVNQA